MAKKDIAKEIIPKNDIAQEDNRHNEPLKDGGVWVFSYLWNKMPTLQ